MRAEKINLEIAGKNILNDVTCEIEPEKITAILGSNGAGKSTLLKCLTGILKPNSGNIFLKNKNLNDFTLKELAEKRAVLSQNLNISFPFTALEIAKMGLEVWDYPENTAQRIVDEALKLVAADHLKNRIFPTLSGGEQQRVNLARVLLQIWQRQDSYLFLDEPTSALDLKYQHLLLQIIQNLKEQINLTSCIIIHDINLAYHYADNLILMKNGKIFKSGKVAEIFTKENLSAIFDIAQDKIYLTV